MPQERVIWPFQFIYMDLVGLITPIGFKGERYYIFFTDDYIRFTIVYTICIKNEWLSILQRYYNWVYIKFDFKIARICTDYRAELYSKKVTTQMDNLGIKFKPAALHAQEENGVVKCLQ